MQETAGEENETFPIGLPFTPPTEPENRLGSARARRLEPLSTPPSCSTDDDIDANCHGARPFPSAAALPDHRTEGLGCPADRLPSVPNTMKERSCLYCGAVWGIGAA